MLLLVFDTYPVNGRKQRLLKNGFKASIPCMCIQMPVSRKRTNSCVQWIFFLFLAELLLWYLTGNILGIEVSCGRCADDVQMTCGWHADDLRMTREWDFGWDFTGGCHPEHHPDTCLSCPISCSTTPGVIRMSSTVKGTRLISQKDK